MLWIMWLIVTASAGFTGAAIFHVLSHRIEERVARRMLEIFLQTPMDDIEPDHRQAHTAWPRQDEW